MIVFTRLEFENFFKIQKRIPLDLEDLGLTLIHGQNLDNQTASSNGCGKSTLFEGLLWSTWGVTSRGLENDDVVNRHVGKNCRVANFIKKDDDLYLIERYRKHENHKNNLYFKKFEGEELIDLTLGTIKATQDRIQKFLGITYDTFIRGPMVPQGTFKPLSRMTDREQKSIFESALQFEDFAQAQVLAKQAYSKAEMEQVATKGKLYHCQDLINQQNEWYLEKRVDLKAQKQRQAQFVVERLKQEHKIIRLVGDFYENLDPPFIDPIDVQSLKEIVEKTEGSFRISHYRSLTDLQNKKAKISANIESLKEAVQKIDSTSNSLKNMEGGVCPTCLQKILSDHVSQTRSKVEKLTNKYKKEIEDNLIELRRQDRQIKNKEKYLQDFLTGSQHRKNLYNNLYQESYRKDLVYKNNLKEIESKENELKTAQDAVESVKDQFQKVIENLNSKFVEVEKTLTKLKSDESRFNSQLERLEKEKKICSFWIQGFSNSGIKSLILESVTPFLNERAEFYSQIISGGDLKIVFHTQVELKNKTKKECFNIEVVNRYGANNYVGNSNGEKSRADLVINLALSDLVSSRAKQSYPQRFFDEPFEGLDPLGVETILSVLHQIAEKSKTILVITHNSEFQGLFERTILVTKRAGVTHIDAAH